MVKGDSTGYRIFIFFNHGFLGILALTTILPLFHILALSLSDNAAVVANAVGLIPKGFNTVAYEYVLRDNKFIGSMLISIKRVAIGTAVNLFLIVVTAYPLAQNENKLRGRNAIVWYFIFPTLFSGGLIPTYLLIRDVGLMDNFFALIVPGAVPIFSVILMMNYIRGLPKEIFEASYMDGAGHLTTLAKICLPLSLPSLATLGLFAMVGHWNAWFDATIYLNDIAQWPLQSLMRSLIAQSQDIEKIMQEGDMMKALKLSNKSLQASQLMLSTVPILLVYPFLQKYFVKGITLGSVKS